MHLKERKNNVKGKLFYSICFVLLATIVILWFVKNSVETHYEEDYDALIEAYYDNQSIYSPAVPDNANTDLYVCEQENTVTETQHYYNNVDSIIRVTDLGIELPVCKGNFKYDMEAYRLSVYSNSMNLGETTYTIMGHHSVALDVAFGWLDQIEEGTLVTVEQNSVIYEYVVTDITIDYASELSYLFSLEDKDIVYLATCDYSLGNGNRIVYRVVKCERRSK